MPSPANEARLRSAYVIEVWRISLLVGRVARAHGNRGQVIVNPDTDFPDERFRIGAVVLVGPSATARTIRAVRFHQGRPIIALEGIETMNDAEALAGAELKVPAGGRRVAAGAHLLSLRPDRV